MTSVKIGKDEGDIAAELDWFEARTHAGRMSMREFDGVAIGVGFDDEDVAGALLERLDWRRRKRESLIEHLDWLHQWLSRESAEVTRRSAWTWQCVERGNRAHRVKVQRLLIAHAQRYKSEQLGARRQKLRWLMRMVKRQLDDIDELVEVASRRRGS